MFTCAQYVYNETHTHARICTYLNTSSYSLRTKRASPCRTESYYLKDLFKQGGGGWWDEERGRGEREIL